MITGNEPARGYGFTTADGTSHVEEKGLTIRQHFAAMAMQGYISAGSMGMPTPEKIAELSLVAADALIEALNQ